MTLNFYVRRDLLPLPGHNPRYFSYTYVTILTEADNDLHEERYLVTAIEPLDGNPNGNPNRPQDEEESPSSSSSSPARKKRPKKEKAKSSSSSCSGLNVLTITDAESYRFKPAPPPGPRYLVPAGSDSQEQVLIIYELDLPPCFTVEGFGRLETPAQVKEERRRRKERKPWKSAFCRWIHYIINGDNHTVFWHMFDVFLLFVLDTLDRLSGPTRWLSPQKMFYKAGEELENLVFDPQSLQFITLNPFGVKVNPALSANLSMEIFTTVNTVRSYLNMLPQIPWPKNNFEFPGILVNTGILLQYSVLYDVIRIQTLPTQAVCLLLHTAARAHYYLMSTLLRLCVSPRKSNPLRSRLDSYVPSPLSHLLIVCLFVSLCLLSTTTLTFYGYYLYICVFLYPFLWIPKLFVCLAMATMTGGLWGEEVNLGPKAKYKRVRRGVYEMEGWRESFNEVLYCEIRKQWLDITNEPVGIFDHFKLAVEAQGEKEQQD
mmetsp:Transcript_26033/g.51935  ORF Transcript_26033/g.51935 Transcript_26033/m.51935 type:complete len:487 (+) Transcript_26033:367-1827(+)|eukprot:CAMPEP_0182460388 /NCGR_PEP_ID=MMETSP1319-20130603/5271_1 /TAXON_ID=172717 /ORGANISM="Bolidomonas pacifica, Strain RCC208" /LENGTH=486 /DNA_ID=CAMNT_0024659479 /DNA_START=346 /DNA_END=1806 /DNA_ORIENTATION=+